MSSFHAFAVHVPIALALLAPFITGVLAWLVGSRDVSRRAWWAAVACAWIVMVGAFVASSSGETERESLSAGVEARALEEHEESGNWFTIVSCVFAVLTLFAGVVPDARKARLLYWANVLLAVAIAAAAIRTGQLGGALVYEHDATSHRPRAPLQGD